MPYGGNDWLALTQEPTLEPELPAAEQPAEPASVEAGSGDGASKPGSADARRADRASELGSADASRDRSSEPSAAGAGGRRGRGRIGALIAVGAAVVIAVIALAVARRPPPSTPTGPAKPPGGAAIRAPEGPQLPGAPATGVRLTGSVVDGAGLPVAGAEVSAELERGAPDRARGRSWRR